MLNCLLSTLFVPANPMAIFGTPPLETGPDRASLLNRAIFTVVGGVTSLTFFALRATKLDDDGDCASGNGATG